MTDIRISIPGEPIPKGRPKFAVIKGQVRAYTPAKTRAAEKVIADAALRFMGAQKPLSGALRLRVEMVFQVPASWTKGKRAAALAGTLPHVGRPDVDNGAKLILDALNGVVWDDDAQVVMIVASKRYGAPARTDIVVQTVDVPKAVP